ncbi:unnamed protein product, partial [Rotaria sordida]
MEYSYLDPSISSTFYHLSTKLSTIKVLKKSKIRARMLQNLLTKIEQGQIIKISMVPEEPITLSDDYSYEEDDVFTNQERILLPATSFVTQYNSLELE